MSSIKKYTKVSNKLNENCVDVKVSSTTKKNYISLENPVLNADDHNGSPPDENNKLVKSRPLKKIKRKNNCDKNSPIEKTDKSTSRNELPVLKGLEENKPFKKKPRLVQTKTNSFFRVTEKKSFPKDDIRENLQKNSSESDQIDIPLDEGESPEESTSAPKSSDKKYGKIKITAGSDKKLISSNGSISKSKKNKLKLLKKSVTPKDLIIDCDDEPERADPKVQEDIPLKKQNSTDVFQVMMDSRNKSIGMNSPGKEIMHCVDPKELSVQRELKTKRSLTLSKWADQKGASKKREIEELHDEHINRVLEKRAKSFKNMLLRKNKGGKSLNQRRTNSIVINLDLESSDNSNGDGKEPFTVIQKRKKRTRDSKCDLNKTSLKKTKLQSPKKIHSLSVNRDPLTCESIKELKNKKIVNEKFLANLSPPLKKKESMLSYFDKKGNDNKADSELVEVLVFEEINEIEQKQDRSNEIKAELKKSKKCVKRLKQKIKNNKSEIPNGKVLKSEDENSSKVNNDDRDDFIEKVEDVSILNVSLRPKRTIRKPIKYLQESSEDSDTNSDDYNIFTSAKKKNNKRKNGKNTNKENVLETKHINNAVNNVSTMKIVSLQSSGALKCSASSGTISLLKRDFVHDEKLAPLFRKSLPKPILDQSVIEARKLFLQSGVPDSIKIQVDKVTSLSENVIIFPAISHVQQIPQKCDSDYDVWNLPASSFTLDVECLLSSAEGELDTQFIFKDFVNIKNLDKSVAKNRLELFNELKSFNYKEGLRIIKERHPHFPVYRTFRQLWEKFTSVPKCAGTDAENSKVNLSEPGTNTGLPTKNGFLWTEKYKPVTSHDILGNYKSVNSIKKWLETWKEYNESSTSKSLKRPRKNSDSSSDFCTSDSESKDSTRLPNNTMIVSGPPGSGKTSCVYAIANELCINVLEVNASSKRTGKKILTELQEATQSHKVLTKMNSDSSMNSFLNTTKKSNEDGKTNESAKCTSKKSLTNASVEKKKSQYNIKASNPEICSQKNSDTNVMSLILIDDADIVFEEDDGFVGALAQLVQSSKRPVLIVTSDLNCNHLLRFMTDSNVIHFNPLPGKMLGPWLDVLILIECNKIIPELSRTLLEFYKGDIRCTMLQLQYWVLGSKYKCSKGGANAAHSLEFHSTDENSMSPSPPCGWVDDDSNSSCPENNSVLPSGRVERETAMSNFKVTDGNNVTCEYNIKMILLSELSQTCNLGNVWLNTSHLFHYAKEIRESDTLEDNLKIVKDCSEKKVNLLDNAFNLFDCLSTVDVMQACNECNTGNIKHPWCIDLKDSLSESENVSMFKNHRYMSSDWCQYMIDNSFKCTKRLFNLNEDQIDASFLATSDSRRNKVKAHSRLSEAVSYGAQLDRSSVALDYMATLRSICRSEKARSHSNFKRNNRFYHYLNFLSVDGKENVYNNACSILDFDSS